MAKPQKNARAKAKRRGLYERFVAMKVARMERYTLKAEKRAWEAERKQLEAEDEAARLRCIVDNVFNQGLTFETSSDQRLRQIELSARYEQQRQAIPNYQRSFDLYMQAYHMGERTVKVAEGFHAETYAAISDMEKYGFRDARDAAIHFHRLANLMGARLAACIIHKMAELGAGRP